MTESQPKALRETKHQQVAPGMCEHQYLELEKNEKGYLTGLYQCTACRALVAKKL
jgi:hypothetical protein